MVLLLSVFFVLIFKGDCSKEVKLVWLIVLVMILVCLFGFVMKDIVEFYLCSVWVIVIMIIVFGFLFWYVDKYVEFKVDEY